MSVLNYNKTAVLISFLLLIFVSISCKKDDDPETSNITIETIGAEGGTIITELGASLIIPEGALDVQTEITVKVIQDAKDSPSENNQLLGFTNGVVLEPDGLQFKKPITLNLPLDEGSDSGSIYYYNSTDNVWELIENSTVDNVNSAVSVQINHFSAYASTILKKEILNKLDDLIRLYSNPQTAVDKYADYLINTMQLMERYDNIHGCCYKVVGFFVNGDYKFNDIEGSFSKKHGETTGAHEKTILSGMIDLSNSEGYVEIINKYLTVYFKCDAEITVNTNDEELDVDEKAEITAVLKCDEKPLVNKKVTFETSAEGVLSKNEATTNEKGEVKVTFTAKKKGIALITAKYNACECKSEEKNVTENVAISIGDEETDRWKGQLVIDVSNFIDDYEPSIEGKITVNFSFNYDSVEEALYDPINHPYITGTGSLTHSMTPTDGIVENSGDCTYQKYFATVDKHKPNLNVSGMITSSYPSTDKIIELHLGAGGCADLITGTICEKLVCPDEPTETDYNDFKVYWPFQLRKKENENSYGLSLPFEDGATYSGVCYSGGMCPVYNTEYFEGTFTVKIWK